LFPGLLRGLGIAVKKRLLAGIVHAGNTGNTFISDMKVEDPALELASLYEGIILIS
jgi:hypothetical protein